MEVRLSFTSPIFGRVLTIFLDRQQKWCTYALHLATFTSLSFAFDPFIIFCTVKAAQDLPGKWPQSLLIAQLLFMALIKVIKLIGLFVREPFDIIFLPVSVIFGYFHGLIKLYAFFTLRMVC